MATIEHEVKIMTILNEMDAPMTAYAIAQEAGLYVNQINPRVTWLVENGVLLESDGVRAKEYELHPILRSANGSIFLMKHMEEMVERADNESPVTPDGFRRILGFLVKHMKIFRVK